MQVTRIHWTGRCRAQAEETSLGGTSHISRVGRSRKALSWRRLRAAGVARCGNMIASRAWRRRWTAWCRKLRSATMRAQTLDCREFWRCGCDQQIAWRSSQYLLAFFHFEGGCMKILMLIGWLCVSAIPAFAQTATTTNACPSTASCGYHGAPAPLLGFGIPSGLAVGGVLLGAKLLRRWRP